MYRKPKALAAIVARVAAVAEMAEKDVYMCRPGRVPTRLVTGSAVAPKATCRRL
jgi:hypothetical protein